MTSAAAWPSRFAGRVALVTGGASGMGAATTRRLAAEGATVIVADRDLTLADAVAASVVDAGGQAEAIIYDQAVADDIERLFTIVADRYDRLDACFANAGVGASTPFFDLERVEWQRHLDVNLTGTFLVCQAAARRMASCRNGGAIVVTASSVVVVPTDQFVAYDVAKAGVEMIAKAAAAELGTHRVRINAVLPGSIDTRMTDPLLSVDAVRAMVEAETPMGRVGTPEDVASVVAFLLSDDAAYVTGTSLLVDGGQTKHGMPRLWRTDHRLAHEPAYERFGSAWPIPLPLDRLSIESDGFGGSVVRPNTTDR